jgi:glycosyltransferase involved in cell wall biosynthesis
MTSPDKPLVTFALFAYNQERFIREAVEGALSQTYSPLEIILSDDCSTDRTFEIMQLLVAKYQGPHKIVFNRNEKNRGLAAHVNCVVSLANGELIVGAAGDDVSKPARVDELFSAWDEAGRFPNSIVSGYELIDESGVVLDIQPNSLDPRSSSLKWRVENGPSVLGATHAFTKRTFQVFGALDEGVSCEDRVIGFRSFLLGPVIEVPKCLVQYRRHENNLWNSNGSTTWSQKCSLNWWIARAKRELRRGYETRQIIRDLLLVQNQIEPHEFRRIMAVLDKRAAAIDKAQKGIASQRRVMRLTAVMKYIFWHYLKRLKLLLKLGDRG